MMNEEKTQVGYVQKHLSDELVQVARFVPKSPHEPSEVHPVDDKPHLRCCGYPNTY